MRLKAGFILLLSFLFIACGEAPSTVFISYTLKKPQNFSADFYPLAVSSEEDYLHFDRGELIVDGKEYREISFSGGINQIKVSDLPEGTYDFYLTLYRGKKAVAWGSIKNVSLKGGTEKHLQIVLNYQEEWE